MRGYSPENFETTTKFGMTVTAEEKANFYKAKAMKTLQEFYDSLPEIECKGKCQMQCSKLEMGADEREYIAEKYGTGRIPEADNTLTCNQLDTETGRCTIHDRRPLLCRLFGLVKDPRMRCPHGCTPERWVPERKARKLMDIIINQGISHEQNNRQTTSTFRKAIDKATEE